MLSRMIDLIASLAIGLICTERAMSLRQLDGHAEGSRHTAMRG